MFSSNTVLRQHAKKIFFFCMSARRFSCSSLQFWKAFPNVQGGVTLFPGVPCLPPRAPAVSCPPCWPRRTPWPRRGGWRWQQAPMSAAANQNHPMSPAATHELRRCQSTHEMTRCQNHPTCCSANGSSSSRQRTVDLLVEQARAGKKTCEDTFKAQHNTHHTQGTMYITTNT